jgi:Protein of unknown function (DUF3037)
VPANSFEYAPIRVVPRVERGECINVGVLLFCLSQRTLVARIELDVPRLLALWPHADVETIREHLEAIPRICAGGDAAGPIGRLPQKERWHWLVAPRSTLVQVGPVHAGLCETPAAALDKLLAQLVRVPTSP